MSTENKKISELEEKSNLQSSDSIPIADGSTGVTKKIKGSVINNQFLLKADKGTYNGTVGDLKDELDSKDFNGVITVDEVSDLPSSPIPDIGTTYKVGKDPISTNNGNWFVNSLGFWEKSETIVDNFTNNDDITLNGDSLNYSNILKSLDNIKGVYYVEKTFDWTASLTELSDCIVVIRYNHDLEGETVNLPSNCVLLSKGGGFSNGTIIGDNTILELGSYQFFSTDLFFGGSFISEKRINLEVFGGFYDGINNDIENVLKAKELSYFLNAPRFEFPLKVVLNNPVPFVDTTSQDKIDSIEAQSDYVLNWAENTDIKSVCHNSEVYFSQHTVPIFLIANADNVSVDGLEFIFTGTLNTNFTGGYTDTFQEKFGMGVKSVFLNTNMSSVLLYSDSNNFSFTNLKFKHITGNSTLESIYFGITGIGKKVLDSEWDNGYYVDNVYGVIDNISFSDYQFGIYCSSQKTRIENIYGTKRRQNTTTPGHLIYTIGNGDCLRNTDCLINNINEDDSFDVDGTDESYIGAYIGTLAIKHIKNSIISNVTSYDKAGLFHSIEYAENNIFKYCFWESTGSFQTTIPIINLSKTGFTVPYGNGSINNTFTNFNINMGNKFLKIIDMSIALEDEYYGNVFDNFFITQGCYSLTSPTDSTYNISIRDRGANRYTNFTYNIVNDLTDIIFEGNTVTPVLFKIYSTESFISKSKSFIDAKVVTNPSNDIVYPSISAEVSNVLTQVSTKGYADVYGSGNPSSIQAYNHQLGSIYRQLDYTYDAEVSELWLKRSRRGSIGNWKRLLHTGDTEVSSSVLNGFTLSNYERVMGIVNVGGLVGGLTANVEKQVTLPYPPKNSMVYRIGLPSLNAYIRVAALSTTAYVLSNTSDDIVLNITYSTEI